PIRSTRTRHTMPSMSSTWRAQVGVKPPP
ncbi:hypothetical protein D046_8231B, partial [Vibrio parahaemolyticus V-223/04]